MRQDKNPISGENEVSIPIIKCIVPSFLTLDIMRFFILKIFSQFREPEFIKNYKTKIVSKVYQSVSLKSLHISNFFMILWQNRGGVWYNYSRLHRVCGHLGEVCKP